MSGLSFIGQAEVAELAERCGAAGVIVVCFDLDGVCVDATGYGRTGFHRIDMGEKAEELFRQFNK